MQARFAFLAPLKRLVFRHSPRFSAIQVSEVTRILQCIESGEAKAAQELLPLVYEELRRLAVHKMANEAPGNTLQPTALVHEAWLRLAGADGQRWNSRNHFFMAATEAMRRIREEVPPRPSTRLSQTADRLPSLSAQRKLEPKQLTNALRGDLDWIVMKALEKERNRRYETANGFALDLHRFLTSEPVLARLPSATDRFQKLIRRNKLVSAATGAEWSRADFQLATRIRDLLLLPAIYGSYRPIPEG